MQKSLFRFRFRFSLAWQVMKDCRLVPGLYYTNFRIFSRGTSLERLHIAWLSIACQEHACLVQVALVGDTLASPRC